MEALRAWWFYIVALIVLGVGAALIVWGGSDALEVGKSVVWAAVGGIFGGAVVQRSDS